MEYRVRLGQTLNTTNLVVDGVFATNCAGANWNCDANWSIAAGIATHGIGPTDHLDATANVFTFTPTLPDTIRYQINFDTLNSVGPARVQIFVGDYSSPLLKVGGNVTHQIDAKHLSPTNQALRIRGSDSIAIDNIAIYNYKWNDPLETQPSLDETSIKLGSGFLLNGLISTFGGELKFTGDGYEYLKAIFDSLASTAYCNRVDIYIERFNEGVWQKHFEGYIYFSDCEFNFKEKNVLAKKIISLTENATTKLLDRQVVHTPFNSSFSTSVNNTVNMDFRDCAAATWGDTKNVFLIFQTLFSTLLDSSEMELALESDFFETTNPNYALATDELLTFIVPIAGDDFSIFITFNDFVTNLNAIFNMGLIDRFSDTIPTLVFEQKQVLGGTSQSFTLDNVDAFPINYSEQNIWSSVNIGWSGSFSTTNGVEFSAWDKFKYTSDVLCSEKQLGLVSAWMADDQAIDDIRCVVGETTDLIIFIAGIDNAGTLEARCAALDASYNLCVETADMMTNHIWSLQSGFSNNNDNAGSVAKANDPFVKEIEFEKKITVAQLDAIRNNPNYLIPFSAPEYNLPVGTEGYIIDFQCDNITMVARFKLLI